MSRSKSPHRVFIIDPQTLFRAGLRKILSTDQEFQVVGDAAALAPSVQQIRKLQPHLVLIENSTTGAQTEKAVERLRQAAAKARIVLLGNSAATLQNGGGVDGVLLKTSSVPSMLRNLRRMASAPASSRKKTAVGGGVSLSSKSEAVAPRDTLTPPPPPPGIRHPGLHRARLAESRYRTAPLHARADGQELPARYLRQIGSLRPAGTGALRHPPSAGAGGRGRRSSCRLLTCLNPRSLTF